MDILMLKCARPLKTLSRVIPYTKGHYDYFLEDFVLKRGKVISIRSKDPLMINLDGEAFFDTNITVKLIPRAVKIAAPNNLSYKKGAPFHEL